MLRRCALLLIGLAVALPAGAQTGWVTLTNSVALTNLDGSGDPINNAEACFEITNNAGQRIGVHIGTANGHAAGGSICTTVTSGTIGSIQLPDTNLTTPQNACIALTITSDVATGGDGSTILGGPGSGYSCLQPAYNNSWCTNGVCDLSKYVPTTAPGVVQTTGPTGPPPNLNIGSVTTLAPGSSASASVTGSGGSYDINLNLPAGSGGVASNAAGGNAQVQFNCSNSFCADSTFTYNSTTHALSLISATAQYTNGIANATQFSGADDCAKISACLASVASTPPGICDARAFTGTPPACASGIVAQSHTTLLLGDVVLNSGSAPVLTSGSAGIDHFEVIGPRPLPLTPSGTIDAGAVLQSSSTGYTVDIGDSTGTNPSQYVYLENVGIQNTNGSGSAANGIRFSFIEAYGMIGDFVLLHSGDTGTLVTLNGVGSSGGIVGNSYFFWNHSHASGGHVGILVHSGTNSYANDQNTFIGGAVSLSGPSDAGSVCFDQDGGDTNAELNIDLENCETGVLESGGYNPQIFPRTENVYYPIHFTSSSLDNNAVINGSYLTGSGHGPIDDTTAGSETNSLNSMLGNAGSSCPIWTSAQDGAIRYGCAFVRDHSGNLYGANGIFTGSLSVGSPSYLTAPLGAGELHVPEGAVVDMCSPSGTFSYGCYLFSPNGTDEEAKPGTAFRASAINGGSTLNSGGTLTTPSCSSFPASPQVGDMLTLVTGCGATAGLCTTGSTSARATWNGSGWRCEPLP